MQYIPNVLSTSPTQIKEKEREKESKRKKERKKESQSKREKNQRDLKSNQVNKFFFCITILKLGEINCQAKVKSKSKKKSKEERLDFPDCMVISPPPTHPTINFSNTSRGPRRQWNTFLRSSQHPLIKSKRKGK